MEPTSSLQTQSWAWSGVYILFAVLCAMSAWIAATKPSAVNVIYPENKTEETEKPPPRATDYLLWLALSALGSLMLLAVTSHITQNVASVPFVWIVPLVLYLLSFILVFDVGGVRANSGWEAPARGLPGLYAP